MTWLKDANGNKCSVEYFGTNKAAQKALDSLEECGNCTNCYGCSECSGCSRCSGCSGCSRCSRCSECSGCSDCSRLQWTDDKEEKKGENAGPPPVPIIPDIHKAVYEASSHPGSLAMQNVHTCDNTHCRAGWVITLAGEAGHKLEEFFNWELAAMKIYDASAPGYKINPERFYDSNAEALADMKALAEDD